MDSSGVASHLKIIHVFDCCNGTGRLFLFLRRWGTVGGKKDAPETYCTYVEEVDDDANKVSQRKRIGISIRFPSEEIMKCIQKVVTAK